jgi:hypothetical protein
MITISRCAALVPISPLSLLPKIKLIFLPILNLALLAAVIPVVDGIQRMYWWMGSKWRK